MSGFMESKKKSFPKADLSMMDGGGFYKTPP